MIAENYTVITPRLFAEGMNAAAGYYRTLAKSLALLGAVWIAMILYTLSSGMDRGILVFQFLIFGAATAWLAYFSPRSRNKQGFAAMEQKNGGDLGRTIRFYEDRCQVESPCGCLEKSYSEIKTVTVTKHLLVLTCYDKTGIIADLNGFSMGDGETVRRRIQSFQTH